MLKEFILTVVISGFGGLIIGLGIRGLTTVNVKR